MDPNETLRLFRKAMQEADDAYGEACEHEDSGHYSLSHKGFESAADLRAAAAEHAENLFNWLANGGYAPDWMLR